jgi:D-amino-acid dehydrogenase
MRLGKHIAVIGAGVVGLAIALKLRREGYRVIVFEPDEPGSHASRGNASLIMTAQVAPISEPGLWRKVPFMLSDPHSPLLVRWTHLPRMTPWFKRFLRNNRRRQYQAITETLAPLTARSLDAWIALIGASEGDRLFKQDGLLYVFRTPKAFRAGKKDAAFRNQHGVYSEVIPAEELRQMEPALGPGLAGGILYPDSAHCTDPQKLTASLSSAFRTTGGEIQRVKVRELKGGSNGVVRLICDEGEFNVDEAIVCAGAWSGPLVRPFGVKPMLAAERGYHLNLRDPQISLRRPIIAGDDRFALTPLGDGIRLAGTSEFAHIDAPPDWRRADMLMEMAKAILPEINGEETASRWMGPRPSTPDSLPLIGRTPKAARIICAFGHGHFGLTLGAVTAEIVADLVAGRDTLAGGSALSPSRF